MPPAMPTAHSDTDSSSEIDADLDRGQPVVDPIIVQADPLVFRPLIAGANAEVEHALAVIQMTPACNDQRFGDLPSSVSVQTWPNTGPCAQRKNSTADPKNSGDSFPGSSVRARYGQTG